LVVSWNAEAPRGTGLKIDARAVSAGHSTDFYTLGFWADDTAEQQRESVTGQQDEDGDVRTDTLVLKKPVERVQLRVTLLGCEPQSRPRLKFLGVSFLNTKATAVKAPVNRLAWGRSLPVPERSQLSYTGGRDWCSPTSLSMVLAYWSSVLQRSELNLDVPEVAGGVYDKNWPGTGNWPFNTAFAGKFHGMRAFVTRLADVTELEILVAARIPPILSVSFDRLHGTTADHGSGHLVVCAGFTDQGDVVVNDPWAALDKGQKVRQVVSRGNLAKAWEHSHRTIYLVCPENWPLPASQMGHW
jgi:hypothetical protein